MKTQYLVGVVLAVVLIGVLFFFMTGMTSTSAPSTDTGTKDATTQNPTTSPVAGSGTLADLIGKGGSWQCSVSTTGANSSTGTILESSGKMRGDFTSTTPAGTITSHMISDGTSVYVWSSAMKTGMKMAAQKPSTTNTPSASDTQNPYNQNYTYSCTPWTLDASQFTLPTDITFNDMSAMTGGAMLPAAPGKAATTPAGAAPNCAMCDQAPAGAARTQCRAALHCN